MSLRESIFDDIDADFRLWQAPSSDSTQKKESVIYSCSILKKSSEKGVLVRKIQYVTKNYIYYKLGHNEPIRGWTSLEWQRVEFNKNEKSFKLIRNLKFCQMHVEYSNDFNKQCDILKNITIQANFYDEYRIVRDIDEGSFAKVVMAERKSDLKTFAVKVFVKDKISKSETKIKSLKNEIQILRKLNHDHSHQQSTHVIGVT